MYQQGRKELGARVRLSQQGRPSKSLTLHQATKLLAAAEGTSMNAYIVLALLIGARTEELRALTWDRLDLGGTRRPFKCGAPSVAMAG